MPPLSFHKSNMRKGTMTGCIRVSGKVICFLGLIALSLTTQTAWADSIQVTFTGQIYFTFDQQFGGPSFYGIQNGNSFSSVLTYDPAQPNLGTVPGQGMYG